MQLLVETYLDGGVEKLRRIRFDARRIEITDNIDQWHGADYRYFKVRGSDGNRTRFVTTKFALLGS
jgi:hypothetical protein